MDDDGLISIGDLVAQEGFKKKQPRRKRAPKAEIKPKRIIRPPTTNTDIDWELNEGENLERIEDLIGVLAGFPFVEEVEQLGYWNCRCGRKVLSTKPYGTKCAACSKPVDLRTTTQQHAVEIVRATAEQQREWEKLPNQDKMDKRQGIRPTEEEERLEGEEPYLLTP
jgi:hypothetical protein